MLYLLLKIGGIADSLRPFMPETSKKIQEALKSGKVEALFQRIPL
jgi:methionyl-tRNA synthetase